MQKIALYRVLLVVLYWYACASAHACRVCKPGSQCASQDWHAVATGDFHETIRLHRSKMLLFLCLVPLLVACGAGSTASDANCSTCHSSTRGCNSHCARTYCYSSPHRSTDRNQHPGAHGRANSESTGRNHSSPRPCNLVSSYHFCYTDRERVLALTNIAGFDWVRQQIVWKDLEGPKPGNTCGKRARRYHQ
jgi:hypothetical protein